MIRTIIDILRNFSEQQNTQSRLITLLGRYKRTDLIKLKLPKKYVPLLEVIAMYGIEDKAQLLQILDCSFSNPERIKNLDD